MVQQTSDQQPAGEDPHQHPGFLEVQRKMRRLVIWSGLIMMIGLAAIIGVIVYKSMGKKESVSVAPAKDSAPITQLLGQQERIISMSADGGYVFVLVEGKGLQSVLQFDAESWQLVRRTQFIPQGQ